MTILTPKQNQIEGVEFILEKRYCILNHEMGTGKTGTAILAAAELDLTTLIVCPASLKQNWLEEIPKFSNLRGLILHTKNDIRNASQRWADIYIVSYDLLSESLISSTGAKFIVCDEAQALKSPDSERFLTTFEIVKKKPLYVALLTGTPINNYAIDFYNLLKICFSHNDPVGFLQKFPNYYRFGHHFCSVKSSYYKTTFGKLKSGKASELKRYIDVVMQRRTSEECLDLPPIIEKDVIVDSGFNDPKLAELVKVDEALEEDGYTSTLKMKAAIAMAPHTAEYAKQLLDAGEGPLIIVSDHPEALLTIQSMLSKFKSVLMTGDTDKDLRHKMVKEFQNGSYDIIAGTIKVIGIGHTLTRARNLIFNDESWLTGDNDQAKKRPHRIGQTSKVIIHRMVGGEVGKKIRAALKVKEADINKILGG